jgi:hypothetical protein
VTWPKGTSIIQVIVEPGADAQGIRGALVDAIAARYAQAGVIVEEVVSVDV